MTSFTRIIANTLAAYARLCVLALVGILATPIVLHTLGPTDYGIFSVIGGTLAFLMFINGALTTGAQRHIAHSLGQGSQKDAAKWFTASLIVHITLGLAVALIAMLASHWILFRLLHLPAGRLAAAVWIYRMVVAAMVCNIISTPFQAMIMAQESFVVLSLINIISAITTMIGALVLKFLPGDSLLWYSTIYCLSQMILFLGPLGYGLYEYAECRHLAREGMRRRNVMELLSFSGWNLFGALAAVIRSQGPAILLNVFVGPAANAAYGLAIQANGFSSEISWGVLRATSPPIVKRHASGDRAGMASLSNLANKYAFVILWVAIAPVLFEVGYCLTFWLRNVPPHTTSFVSLLLIALLIDQLTSGFGAALQATGRIAAYQVVVGGVNCLGVPIGYVMLRMGLPANSVLWAGIGAAMLGGCCRLWFAIDRVNIPIRDWLTDVVAPSTACVLTSSAAMFTVSHLLRQGLLRLVGVVIVNAAVVGVVMWYVGVTPEHRLKLSGLYSGTIRRLLRQNELVGAAATIEVANL